MKWSRLGAGLRFGLVVGLLFGGSAYIQHFVLRWFLRGAGAMSWNYARFLDYAADHLLLRKVGGGYIFIHRLLLEYFASLPLSQSLINDEQTQPAAPAQDGL